MGWQPLDYIYYGVSLANAFRKVIHLRNRYNVFTARLAASVLLYSCCQSYVATGSRTGPAFTKPNSECRQEEHKSCNVICVEFS